MKRKKTYNEKIQVKRKHETESKKHATQEKIQLKIEILKGQDLLLTEHSVTIKIMSFKRNKIPRWRKAISIACSSHEEYLCIICIIPCFRYKTTNDKRVLERKYDVKYLFT